MYLRKWTRMRWFDKMSKLYELGVKQPEEEYQHLQRFPPFRTISGSIPARAYKDDLDNEIIKTLFQKYPDLQYTNSFYAETTLSSTSGHHILDFVRYQKALLRKGYSKEKSFELTEKKFQDRLSHKFEEAIVTQNLAYNNNARSLLSVAEQIAEAESRFKVNRVTRDLYLYTESKKEFEKTLKDYEREAVRRLDREDEEDLGVEEEAVEEVAEEGENSIFDIEKEYHKVIYKFVPKKGSTIEDPKTTGERKQVINEFVQNTKNMFNLYYERASALDRLSGLKDNEIMNLISGTPSQLKRQTKTLLQKLNKYNIKLDANGEVDYSGCSFPHVVKKLKENPLVKIALLQQDLEYEFPHKEVQMELAKKIKQDHEEYQREAERIRKANEKPEEEDLAIATDDSPFHKQYGISYPKADLLKPKQESKSLPTQDLNETDLLSPEATYRVFETYEERMARLEKKWLQNRLASLEAGPERPTTNEQMTLINQAVDKLRRVKFLVDQKNLENAKDLIFEEHKVFTPEEMLADSESQAEKLTHYLAYPEEKRRLSARNELDDDKMLRMIARKEIVEDTVQPFSEHHNHRLEEQDTREYKHIKMRERQLELSRKRAERLSSQKDEEEDRRTTPDQDEGEAAKTKDTGKTDKKKLVDYIKQTTEKGAKKAQKPEKKK